MLARLLTERDLAAVAASHPLDISPPTDDRPFFFHMLRLRDALGAGTHSAPNDFNLRAVTVLGALLAIVLALTVLCVLGPLLVRGGAPPASALPWLAYFAAIGLGFMFVEISQVQRLIVFLGHPIYGLSVLLFALLLSSGLGSLLVPAIADPASARRSAWRLPALVVAVVVFGVVTPTVSDAFRGDATWIRIAVAAGLLFPLGLFLGAAFPIGMGAASLRHPSLTPWLWGVNGATSVCASVLAIAISLSLGISIAFWVGALCYLGAALALAAGLRRLPT
jgi:hypothetical protein